LKDILTESTKKSSGFTLIETIIAAAVFSFVLVGVLGMTSAHVRSNHHTNHHTRAVQLAEDGMEWLRRLDYNTELAAADGLEDDFFTLAMYPDYRREFRVNWGAELTTMRVDVTWRTQGRNAPPITLTSIRTFP